jgi:Flp pilus assembly protein TadD
MPDFAENHSALAYLFYRLDDGPNAIAEARTALSIDPKNAEAYQFLGLGSTLSVDYQAAVHAYANRSPRPGQRRHLLRHGNRSARRESAARDRSL